MPPADFSAAPAHLLQALSGAFGGFGEPVLQGATWTTDAPFRETAAAIDAMTQLGLLAVEMEAAALYAFAAARGQDVVCFAHVTNQMVRSKVIFEKGERMVQRRPLPWLPPSLAPYAPFRPPGRT